MCQSPKSWILSRMEYEYDHDPNYGGRVLWGRVAVFGIALLLMFLAGRCTAGGGVDPDEFQELSTRAEQLELENEGLRQEVAALAAGSAQTPTDGATEPTLENQPATKTYVVRPGDTLFSIAQEQYNDGQKFQLIADANGIDQNNRLRVGQELIIPPAE